MHLELLFKLSFVLLFVSAVAIRVRYQRVAGTYQRRCGKAHRGSSCARGQVAVDHPPSARTAVVRRGPVLVLCSPVDSMVISALPLWIRAGGLVLAGLGLLLLWRSHSALGKNFRPTLEVPPDQELVIAGPYRDVRHPLYLAFLLMLASTGLLSSTGLSGWLGCCSSRPYCGKNSGRRSVLKPAFRRALP